MAELNLDKCLEAATEIAKQGGKIAKEALEKDHRKAEHKESTSDLVTETDKKVEELIISSLRQRFPKHKFIGEETFADNGEHMSLTDDPTWMIDPIDGTSNFVHGFPFSAVSIGMVLNKQPVVGVVYNFVLDQLYTARKGTGALLNGKPIRVSKCTELNKALVLTEFGNNRPEEILKPKLEVMHSLGAEPDQVIGIRSLGSAALNSCMVASGCADSYYEYGVHCWDIAASVVIIQEAGGVCISPSGEPLNVMKRAFLCASTHELASKLVPHMKHIDYPEDK